MIAVDKYEFAEDTVRAWAAESISEGYEEEKTKLSLIKIVKTD
jgi:hypothetical protein